MRNVVILFPHLIVTVIRLAGPGGLRSVVAESLLVKHQLRILNRGRKRAPNLRVAEHIIAGVWTHSWGDRRLVTSEIKLFLARFRFWRETLGAAQSDTLDSL